MQIILYRVCLLQHKWTMNMFRRRAHDYDMNLEAKSLKIWWFFCHEFHFFLGKILSKSVKGFLEVWSTPFPTLPLIRQMRPWRIPNYPNPNPTLNVFRWTRVCLSTRWCCLGPTWWRAAARFSSLPSASTPRLKSTIDALWILSAKVTFSVFREWFFSTPPQKKKKGGQDLTF